MSRSAFSHDVSNIALTVEKMRTLINLEDAIDSEATDMKSKEKKKAAGLKLKFHSKKSDDSGQEAYIVLAGYFFVLRAWLKDQISSKDVKVPQSPLDSLCILSRALEAVI